MTSVYKSKKKKDESIKDVYLLQNHDIEIEGRMKFGDSLMNQLTNGLNVHNDLRSGKSLLNLLNKDRSVDDLKEKKHKGHKKLQPKDNVIAKRGEKLDDNQLDNEDDYLKEEDEALKQIENPDPQRRNYVVDSSQSNNKRSETRSRLEFARFDVQNKKDSIKYDPSKKSQIIYLEDESRNDDYEVEESVHDKKLGNNEHSVEENANYSVIYTQLPQMKNKLRTAEFLDHVVQNGRNKIQSVAGHIQIKLGVPEITLTAMIKSALDSYTSKLNRYISHVIVQDVKSDNDKEFLLLDIIASCNMLLYSEQRQLLNKMIEKKGKNVTHHEIDLLTEKVYKQYVNHKKQEIFYICEKLNICRSFPGFSDYLAEFFSELLKLPDKQLRVIIEKMAYLVTRRTIFFKTFMKNDIATLIAKKLKAILKKLFKVTETLSAIRSIITQRFKLMKTKDYQVQIRTKAVRILIDIIDKTFSLATGEDITLMTFDTVVKSLRRWSLNNEYDINEPLKLLMQHIVSVTTHNWDEDIQEEVATLTEVIMTGKTEATELLEQLFSRGAVIGKLVNVIPDDDDSLY